MGANAIQSLANDSQEGAEELRTFRDCCTKPPGTRSYEEVQVCERRHVVRLPLREYALYFFFQVMAEWLGKYFKW
jgi:hypothetical protein